jgi:hypothetical protein
MAANSTGVSINLWRTPFLIQELARRTGDLSPVLRKFHAYHSREINSVFNQLGRGGTYRGLTWKDFGASSMPHMRKDGKGMTLGRKRPSGKRVSEQSKLLQDTGALRQDASTGVFVLTRDKLQYGPSKFYAQAQYSRRSPYSVTKADQTKLMQLLLDALTQAGGRT